MANTITDLYPDLYAALDVVSRELVGMIPSVTVDARVNRAPLNTDVVIGVSPVSNAAVDITPAMSVPAAADQTIGNTKIQINKAKAVPFSWEGNEQERLNMGQGYLSIQQSQIAQAMRTLTNLIEVDLCALQSTFSRAYGTAGTTPFATAGDFTDASEVLRILKDNGSPQSDNNLVMNTAAGAKFLGKQAAADLNATNSILRQGVLLDVTGMSLRESAQVVTQTAGTMASATTTSAAFTVGQTILPLAAVGTGVVAAGDVITVANDTNKYVVTSVSFAGANPAAADTITIAAPGLKVAQSAATRAITVVATSARNMAFNRSAIVLATRMPERPKEGDLAIDVGYVTDPRSGITFEVSIYPGYRKVRYEVAIAWGVKNIKPAHTALLLG